MPSRDLAASAALIAPAAQICAKTTRGAQKTVFPPAAAPGLPLRRLGRL